MCWLFINQYFAFDGNIGWIIFDPSSGGNGIKLNTPKPIFTIIALNITANVTCPIVAA